MMTGVNLTIDVLPGDLTEEWHTSGLSAGRIAWDIETSGLDWQRDSIGTCQIAVGDRAAVVILDPGRVPARLANLLERDDLTKVFHHALFDLRFMAHAWGVTPASIACTKIASKILSPQAPGENHSLISLLGRHMQIQIAKDQQVSDWLGERLSQAQITYAATDVLYLVGLLDVLTGKCSGENLSAMLEESFRYIPTRLALDLRGSGDVFAY